MSIASVVLALLAALLPRHDGLHEKLAAADAAIAARPQDAGRWLLRGELRRLHRDYAAAGADLRRAGELEPELAGLALAWARLELARGRLGDARAQLAEALARDPRDVRAWMLQAEVLERAGEPWLAVGSLSHAIALDPATRPEVYLERARLQASLGSEHLPCALRGLDQGLARLGVVPALELRAVDLELELGRIEAALARVDRLAARAQRQERWLALRGDVLARAGREREARAAWRAALALIQRLPARHRRTRATRQLELELAEHLADPEH